MNSIYEFFKMRIVFLSMVLIMPGISLANFGIGENKSSLLDVSTTVAPFCSINANPLAFRNYSMTTVTASTSILVTCTKGTNYSIALDYGRNNNNNLRNMRFNANILNYQLYQDEKMSRVWGDTQNNVLSAIGNGELQTYKIYGNIPVNQNKPLGTYDDVVLVNINISNPNNQNNLSAYQMMVRMNVSVNKI